MAVALFTNNGFSTLNAGITNVATSITVASGDGALFPNPSAGNYFYATLIDTSNNLEIIKCTARATDTLTVVRGQESTSGAAFSTGDRIELRLTAAGILEHRDDTSIGKHSIPVPAVAMYATTTSPAAAGSVETTTNKVEVKTWDFDATADEYVQFQIPMPSSWDEGTVTFTPLWSHAATTTNFGVSWALQGVAFGNSDALDVAFGTAVVVDDTGGTTDDLFIGAESGSITIAGSPAVGDMVIFRLLRDVSDTNDTMAIDARLHGIVLNITTEAAVDA